MHMLMLSIIQYEYIRISKYWGYKVILTLQTSSKDGS